MTEKTKRLIFFILAIPTTAFMLLSVSALTYAVRDMRHEGLTYSQWYEGSIRAYYLWLSVFLMNMGLCIAAWITALRRLRPHESKRDWMARRRAFHVMALLSAALGGVFAYSAFRRNVDMLNAAGQVEALAPYIHAYESRRVCTLLSLEGFFFSLFGLVRSRSPKQER